MDGLRVLHLKAELAHWKAEYQLWARVEGFLSREEFARKRLAATHVECYERAVARALRETEGRA